LPGQRPRDEARLARRHEVAATVETERGAGVIARKSAQSGASEVAVIARCPALHRPHRPWPSAL